MNAQAAGQAIGTPNFGSLDTTAKVVVQILRAQDPKKELLSAFSKGAIPDQVGLELVEEFDEVVKVKDFDKSMEIIACLLSRGTISSTTEQILFLAVIDMIEQEEVGQTKTGQPAPVLQSPAVTDRTAIIRAATELRQQLGPASEITVEKLGEIRGAVEKLSPEEFNSLRQLLSSLILAQAELPADSRQIDVYASLEVVDIILGQRQAELYRSIFAVYEILNQQGYRLRDRDLANRPLVTVRTITLLRNRFRVWLDSHRSELNEEESVKAEKSVRTLERFLLAAAHESVREAIRADLAARLRENYINSGTSFVDLSNNEQVGSLPQTIVAVVNEVSEFLEQSRKQLTIRLKEIGDSPLAEANTALNGILSQFNLCSLWRSELAEIESSDYNPAGQRPNLTDSEKRVAFFETERKELVSILREIEDKFEESHKLGGHKSPRKQKRQQVQLTDNTTDNSNQQERKVAKSKKTKLEKMKDITIAKIERLDLLIAKERSVTIPQIPDGIPPPPATAIPLPPPPPPVSAEGGRHE